MALKKTIVFKGIEIKDAYMKVWSYEGNKSELRCGVSIQVDSNGEMLDSKQYQVPYTLDGENPVKQSYEYLKTLPEFEGAQDC